MNKKMFEQLVAEEYDNNDARANIIRWVSWDKSYDVLELGAESIMRSKEIANRVNSLTCVTKEVNSYTCNHNNVTVEYSSTKSFLQKCEKKFDVILLLNVLEHTEDLCDSTEVLLSCKDCLKENGKIIIACDNPLGMRYWAGLNQGDKEEISFFAFLQGNKTKKNQFEFTKIELEKLISKSGLKFEEFYYPYPNVTFPMAIYCDSYLPHKGELNINDYSVGAEYLRLFDVTKAYDTILEQEMFPFFSNSYMVILHM